VFTPGSHCPACGHRLTPWELVPVLSFLWLRGKCRSCGAPIPPRTLAVELLTAASFGLLWFVIAPGAKLVLASAYTSVLLLVAIIDIEHQRIPNVIVLPASVVAPFAAVAYGIPLELSLIGSAIGFVSLGLPYFLMPGGMGAGDVKLAVLVGAMSGYPLILLALFTAIVMGAAVGLTLMLFRTQSRNSPIAFGPFLAGGAIITLLFGQTILDWYVRFF